MLKIYELLWNVLLPFIHIFLQIRAKHGKEDPDRIEERYGDSSITRPNGTLLWIHAASVGETLTALTFIRRLKPLLKDSSSFLITTNTVSSANLLLKEHIDDVIHQYIPLDYKPYVRKFFQHWNPNYAFFFESELWPTLINECTANHMFLVNGRLSDRSFKKWKYFSGFIKSMLKKFSKIMAQTKEDANRFSHFSKTKVIYTGNIKYSTPALKVDNELLDKLKTITKKYVLVAASTHEGEDHIILDAYQEICKKIGQNYISLIIIPRHPIRALKIYELASQNYKVCIRSKLSDSINDVICVDSFGEMGTFFSIADFVFIGGSLVRVGGHNIFEPILFQKPVMYGPHMFNFREMKDLLEQSNVGFQVMNASDIAELFCKYISNEKFHNKTLTHLTKLKQEDPMKNVISCLHEFGELFSC